MTTIYCIRPKGFNVGNEVIHLGLRHFLNVAFGESVNIINLPATSRYESSNKAGLTPQTIHEINQYGDGVIVGGGNLYENGELDVNAWSLETLDVPLMLFSLSLGRIYNRRGELVRRTDSMSNANIRALHEKASLSLARDSATVEHLGAAGAASTLGGCPTLYIDEIPQHLIPLATDAADVLVSVRTPGLMNVPITYQQRVKDDIRAIVDHISASGYQRIKLLCHDHRDVPFAASIEDMEYVFTDDVYAYLSLLKSAEFVVSYRLHAVLPCLAYGTPVVKISYDERATSLLDTIGLGSWNVNMIDEPNVAQAVINRLDRFPELEELRASSRPWWDELRDRQLTALQAFAEQVRELQRRNDPGTLRPVTQPDS